MQKPKRRFAELMKKNSFWGFVACFLLSGCTSTAHLEEKNPDPYEHYNRNASRFNDKLDKTFVKPVAQKYVQWIPASARTGVRNVLSNLNTVPTLANDVLQANFYWTMNDFWRLVINSTVGLGGLFDVASRMGLTYHTNSFGMTLSHWGAKPTPYVVLPFLTSSTLGDAIGLPIDNFANPVNYAPWWVIWTNYPIKIVDLRAELLPNEKLLSRVALDPYLFIREAYIQNRIYRLKSNVEIPLNASEGES